MSKQIRIKITSNGTVEAETLGMKGKECLKYLNVIEQMANATTIDSEFTKEYYEVKEETIGTVSEEVRNGL